VSEVTDSFILKKAFGSLCSLTVLEVFWKDNSCFAQGADGQHAVVHVKNM